MTLASMGRFLLLVLDRRGGGVVDSGGGRVVMLLMCGWENEHVVWSRILCIRFVRISF
jgi:hypothetical protein